MPWNDNANSGQKPGPWGSPPPSGGGGGGGTGGGPGGGSGDGSGGPKRPRRPSGGGGGGNPPPDLGDLGRQFRDQMNKLFGAPGGGGGGVSSQTLAMVGGGIVGLWLIFGSFYIVQPNEEAVVKTFGAYTATAGPGLRVRLPWPIQTNTNVAVTDAQRTEIGGTEGADKPKESLMLTGDENIVNVSFTVLWRKSDPAKYLFNLDDADSTVQAVAESAMREVVGRTALDPILTNGRGRVQDETRSLMQKVLDSYGSGITVNEVQIRNAGPPPDVVDAFRDVARAQQEAQSRANQGRAEQAKIVQDALGYKAQVVQEAEGEAARFNSVYAQYKAAPGVTRQRLYIETMERVLKNTKKVIVDSKGAQAPIILPPDAFRPRTDTTPAAPAQGAAR